MADPKVLPLTPDLARYAAEHSTPPDEVARHLIRRTEALGDLSAMQVAPEQGALLTLLTRALGVRRAVEVGTFTGLSALSIARGLPEDGSLLCCDVSEEWTGIAQRAWQDAGVADRIELRIGPAADTLRSLDEGEQFDLAFVDADKQGYETYVDLLHTRLRTNGLVLVDNVLWYGLVIDPRATDRDTAAIRAFNDAVAADPRWEVAMTPIADGLTFLRKR